MIETERQRQAALSWIGYWKASVSAGEQSWLGQEEALETIMALHQQIDAYERRVRAVAAVPKSVAMQAAPEIQNVASLGARLSAGAENGHVASTRPSELTAHTSSH